MAKNRHSEDYTKSFKAVKKNLDTFYVHTELASSLLKRLESFYLFLEYSEFGVYPRFLAKGKDVSIDISDAFSLDKRKDSLAIGYKRSDDLLDIKGSRFSKSASVQRTLEYVRCDSSWIKWALYKAKLFFSKK
jgi:hypothetical protein